MCKYCVDHTPQLTRLSRRILRVFDSFSPQLTGDDGQFNIILMTNSSLIPYYLIVHLIAIFNFKSVTHRLSDKIMQKINWYSSNDRWLHCNFASLFNLILILPPKWYGALHGMMFWRGDILQVGYQAKNGKRIERRNKTAFTSDETTIDRYSANWSGIGPSPCERRAEEHVHTGLGLNVKVQSGRAKILANNWNYANNLLPCGNICEIKKERKSERDY